MDEPDYYEVLEVSRKASQEVIEAAYRRLARKHHPDCNTSDDAAERMRQINAAFDVLGSPVKRSRYDCRRGFDCSPRTEQETKSGSAGTSSPDPSQKTDRNSTGSEPPKPPPRGACDGHDDIQSFVARGGRFVVYQYAVSVVLLTFRRSSRVYRVEPGQVGTEAGKYTLISLLFGWWGIPWGPIFTIQSIVRNSSGGVDVTKWAMTVLAAGGYFDFAGNSSFGKPGKASGASKVPSSSLGGLKIVSGVIGGLVILAVAMAVLANRESGLPTMSALPGDATSQPYRPSTATARPLPTAVPVSQLRLDGAVLCKSVDPNGRAVTPTSTFSSWDIPIYVTVGVSNWQPGGSILVKWFYGDEFIIDQKLVQNASLYSGGYFPLQPDSGPQLVGDWRVEIYVKNFLGRTQQLTLYFTVVP